MVRTIGLAALLLVHGVISAVTMWEVGYIAIFESGWASWGGAQVFSDLCVSLVLITSWMVGDARRSGIPVWPFLVATPFLGSFAPLGYLILREARRDQLASAS